MDVRLDDIEVVEFQRVPSVVTGDKQFVKLLARPDADRFLLAVRADGRRKIGDPHRWDFRNEYLAAAHHLQTLLDKTRAVLEADPEARHARIGDWQLALTALLGLFGVAAFVTGKDAFTGLDMWAKIVAAVAVVCALSIGVVAVFVSNRAAYGWPELMKVKTDEDLLKWHDDRPKRLQKAARRMKIAVWLAIVSLGFVTLAAVLMWLAPRHVDKTNASNAGQNIPVISLAASRLGERC